MRARDFVTEGQSGVKIDPQLKAAIEQELLGQINSLRKNVLPLGFFQIYDIMNTVAMANGVDQLNVKHPVHNHDVAAPYTEVERKMLQAAYTAMDQPWDNSILDLSTNPEATKTDGAQSPVIGFKGYTR